jgi:hypothetical protein
MNSLRSVRQWFIPLLLVSSLLSGQAQGSGLKEAGTAATVASTYQQAKAELPQQLYPYYRLLDRIMSTNQAIQQ